MFVEYQLASHVCFCFIAVVSSFIIKQSETRLRFIFSLFESKFFIDFTLLFIKRIYRRFVKRYRSII